MFCIKFLDTSGGLISKFPHSSKKPLGTMSPLKPKSNPKWKKRLEIAKNALLKDGRLDLTSLSDALDDVSGIATDVSKNRSQSSFRNQPLLNHRLLRGQYDFYAVRVREI